MRSKQVRVGGILVSTAMAAGLIVAAPVAGQGPAACDFTFPDAGGSRTGDLPAGQTWCGGPGNDRIVGNVLAGGMFIGGGGADSVTGDVTGTFDGGPGPDSVGLWVRGTFTGGEGDDVVVQDVNGDGHPGATFDGGPGADTVRRNVAWGATFDGGDGVDVVVGRVVQSTVNGGDGADRVDGSIDTDGAFNGGAGDDVVFELVQGSYHGGPGNDVVHGNVRAAGVFDGGDGGDRIDGDLYGSFVGGSGADHIVGSVIRANSVFDGGDGADSVDGNVLGTFEGGLGNDRVGLWVKGTFNGGEGDDLVVQDVNGDGQPGAIFNGGPGDDTVARNVAWDATFVGGDGADTVKGGIYTVRRGQDDPSRFDGGPGPDKVGANVELHSVFDGGDGADSVGLWVIGTFTGGAGDDTVIQDVNGASAVFDGGPGDDTVKRNVAWDAVFNGGDGVDTVKGRVVRSTFNGGAGEDTVGATVDTNGAFNGGGDDDSLKELRLGTFSGGPGRDTLGVYTDGVCTSVEAGCEGQAVLVRTEGNLVWVHPKSGFTSNPKPANAVSPVCSSGRLLIAGGFEDAEWDYVGWYTNLPVAGLERWRVRAWLLSDEISSAFEAYGECILPEVPPIEDVQIVTTDPISLGRWAWDHSKERKADCPVGYRAVGGGWQVFDRGVRVGATYPTASNNGWWVRASGETGGSTQFTVTARCMRFGAPADARPVTVSRVTSDWQTIRPGDPPKTLTVGCDAAHPIAMGGGFEMTDAPPVPGVRLQGGSDTPVRISSSRPTPSGWQVDATWQARSGYGSPQDVRAWALCLGFDLG